MIENNYLVYCFTAPNGRRYIGQTKNLERRIRKHQNDNGCTIFFHAIKKYGFASFTQEILIENLSVEEANDWEVFYIKEFNTLSPNGYNLRTGGKNHIASAETRIRMSESRKGHIVDEETRLKISNANKGKTRTVEEKKKMSESQKSRPPMLEETKKKMSGSRKGHLVSEKSRLKISESNKGKIVTEEVRLKISTALKGIPLSEAQKNKRKENRKPISEETRKKLSDSSRGRVYAINKKTNTSGHKGVYWRADRETWRVIIRVDGSNKNLGYFKNKEDACLAYRKAAQQFHGKSANTLTI
ncbi:MAG: NUMOD3 domain-containing DNA-binding protein [Methylococcales bacterium]|nr:NUMOD3 domain-containing DNA-binding protein [Methylococcales bacterium]